MGPVQIIFVLLTAAIPGWMYYRSSDDGLTPKIKWSRFETNLNKILDGSGGFQDCTNEQVVGYLRALCEKSMEQWTAQDSIMVERASGSVVFSCEARNDVTFVQWKAEASSDGDIKCGPGPRADLIGVEPAFVFDKKGELDAIEFWGRDGRRQSVNAVNCRRKAQLAHKKKLKFTSENDADRLPRLKSDPADFITANRLCFGYDVDDNWAELRRPAGQ